MIIFNNIYKLLEIKHDFILTIGNFDGFHIGHLTILNKMARISEFTNLKKVAITFKNKPQSIIEKRKCNINIIPLKDKIQFFKKNNFKYLFLLDFNEKIKNITKTEFIDLILKNKHFKGLIVGENFRFGKNREGNTKFLEKELTKKNLIFHAIPIKFKNGVYVSSSYIREKIKNGDLSINKFLNEPFYIKGIVEKGKQLGRTINYPTANIYVFDQIKPLDGVYFTITEIISSNNNNINYIDNNNNIKQMYYSMTFVGHDGHVETHIFNFNGDLYGKEIKVYFIAYIRENKYIEKFRDLKILLDNDKIHIYNNFIKKYGSEKQGVNYEQFFCIY